MSVLFGEDLGWLSIIIFLKNMKEYCLEGENDLFFNDYKRVELGLIGRLVEFRVIF